MIYLTLKAIVDLDAKYFKITFLILVIILYISKTMNKEQLIMKLNMVKDYIEQNTVREEVIKICENNPYQQIGWYRGALESVAKNLETIKEWIDEQ